MNRKVLIPVVAACCVLLAVLVSMKYPAKRFSWHSCSRIILIPNTNMVPSGPGEIVWLQLQSTRMSNRFSSPATKSSIAERTGISTNRFTFEETRNVRSTPLIELHFYAATSNEVWRVGCAATDEMIGYYRTNQPEVALQVFDPAGAGRRPPMWKDAWDWVKGLFPW